MEHTSNAQKGFSLIEILVVIAIIGVLMAGIIPVIRSARARAARQTTISNIRLLKIGIENYKDDIGELPESLKDIVRKPADEKLAESWAGPYYESKSKETPKDGFGNPFQYSRTPGAENEYELYSYGANGKGSKSGRIDAWKI